MKGPGFGPLQGAAYKDNLFNLMACGMIPLSRTICSLNLGALLSSTNVFWQSVVRPSYSLDLVSAGSSRGFVPVI